MTTEKQAWEQEKLIRNIRDTSVALTNAIIELRDKHKIDMTEEIIKYLKEKLFWNEVKV